MMYEPVQVICEKASFALIEVDTITDKRDFKKWLEEHGEDVKRKQGMWFGNNMDKRTQDKNTTVRRCGTAGF